MIKTTILICLPFFLLVDAGFTQTDFNWTELLPMPERVSNNALASAVSNDTLCVYSFAGIDSTLSPAGIHNRVFKYNTISQVWTELAPLPDGMTRIAAAASTVNNKIYIIGGYHVFSNFTEESLDFVHVFDPETDSFLPDATPLPVAIDDHVQAVWRDSLIYIIAGWSQTTNVSNVQVYNPALNEWSVGTAIPNNSFYKAFGASGAFVGDTVYYNGGARIGINFPGTSALRKGVVSPDNPTEISWSVVGDNPGEKGYRMGAISLNDRVFWIGGGGQTYNFDGIAYNGSGVVQPLPRIMQYHTVLKNWSISEPTPFLVMDMRGVAKISDSSFIVSGGMTSDAQVSNAIYLVTVEIIVVNVNEIGNEKIKIGPVPTSDVLFIKGIEKNSVFEVINTSGQEVMSGKLFPGNNSIDTQKLSPGNYILKIRNKQNTRMLTFFVSR